jgi:hypothetical protein
MIQEVSELKHETLHWQDYENVTTDRRITQTHEISLLH